MNTAWWKGPDELDEDQKGFIGLPPTGRHLLVGPPGSGKTNLLLLRAIHVAKSGGRNILVLTYTNLLADFLRSGIARKDLVADHQVMTFHRWAFLHVGEYLGRDRLDEVGDLDTLEGRESLGLLLAEANQNTNSRYLYDAIFVDEAQDLALAELKPLLELAPVVCVCGDIKQSIYRIKNLPMNGLDIADLSCLQVHELKKHYRIGPANARVADRILVPSRPEDSLESTTNYNTAKSGKSSANLHQCESRSEQFGAMLEKIGIELVAFKGDLIGVLCPRVEAVAQLHALFQQTELKDLVVCHGITDSSGFELSRPIHVMTVHSSKGAEFRAVHLFGVEDFKFPLHHREIIYTAVTRAKTALNAYYTGSILKPIESAFLSRVSVDISELFGGQA